MTQGAARPRRWLVITAVALCVAAGTSVPAAAQPLAVPYLPQTEDLCGGAAAAMVMRYWGASDAYPDAFAPLVERAAGGIRASALVTDLQRRGWSAVAAAGSAGDIAKEIGRGRPVIALIEDRPRRYHYVVVVGWSGGKVVLHDPARAPSRVLDAARFDAAWQKSDRWMLILLPPPGPAPSSGAPPGEETATSRPGTVGVPRAGPGTGADAACAARVDAAVARAAANRSEARALLEGAGGECAGTGAVWRELAGLDALDADWSGAAAHARRAVAIDPDDSYAWRILATARYVRHDDLGALAAWNRVGEPAVNLVDIQGLQHTRYGVVADAIGVELKTVLTPAAIRLAERRVRDVPSIAAARVTFHPVENGRAQVDASVLERDRAPLGYAGVIRIGFGALTDRELAASFSSLTGGGEAAGGGWRWWAHRPMVSGFYAAPAPRSLGGGVWRLDASRETQTFGRVPFEETRTRVAMSLATWLTGRTRFTTTAAADRWKGRHSDVALSGGLEHWPVIGRVKLQADVTRAIGADAFTLGAALAGTRSRGGTDGVVLFGIGGYSYASGLAPASVWPGADTGQARDVLLRAHPLLDAGIITGGAFGRRLAFGTIEAQRWTPLRHLPVRIAPAAFIDVARATRGLDLRDARTQFDAGAGIRVSLPGGGTMRIDVAHGLRDGGTVLSAGWDRRWRSNP